jgi:glycosyltransferase involved in cell wall biosynthesis
LDQGKIVLADRFVGSNMGHQGSKIKNHGPYKQHFVKMLMEQYHWVIMGSRWYENSPVVIQEAISSHTPLLVPNHGGMHEKVFDNGLTYEPDSPISLANQLIKLSEKIYSEKSLLTNKKQSTQEIEIEKNFNQVLSVLESK